MPSLTCYFEIVVGPALVDYYEKTPLEEKLIGAYDERAAVRRARRDRQAKRLALKTAKGSQQQSGPGKKR